jgi:hypothetical protein
MDSELEEGSKGAGEGFRTLRMSFVRTVLVSTIRSKTETGTSYPK